MIRWRRIIGLGSALFCLLAPGAQAASFGRAALKSCDRERHEATFEGRMTMYRPGQKMQLRFTLQGWTPDERRWRRIEAPGFDAWITAPAGYGRYSYDKTVEALLAPASYRTVVNFRWREARGHIVRRERATSPVCHQPDSRPDLVVRALRHGRRGYVAEIANRGHSAAGPFAVAFLRAGEPAGSAPVGGLAAGRSTTVVMKGMPCAPGEKIEAIADSGSDVDESDEADNSRVTPC